MNGYGIWYYRKMAQRLQKCTAHGSPLQLPPRPNVDLPSRDCLPLFYRSWYTYSFRRGLGDGGEVSSRDNLIIARSFHRPHRR